MSLSERFWSKVDKSGDCWTWTAVKDKSGYGQFRLDGQMRRAHRVAYQLSVGEVPDGMLIDHICHQPSCVNPEHLRPVTRKENGENRSGANKNSGSGVRGVSPHSKVGWEARVGTNGSELRRYFTTFEEAASAVREMRLQIHTHSDMDRMS